MLIEIQDLKFSYRLSQGPLVLDIPSLKIARGEKVFLQGPSGSGKTTLLEVLAGIIAPQSGSVRICGQELGNLGSAKRDLFRANHIGYIFQSFNLIPYLSVFDNIALPLHFSQQKRQYVSSQDERQVIENLCLKLGIADFLTKGVTELSIGQQQRVAAARAIVGRPELILADEPTSALDYDHRQKFIEVLFDVSREFEQTIVFVSHDHTLKNLFNYTINLAEINRASRK